MRLKLLWFVVLGAALVFFPTGLSAQDFVVKVTNNTREIIEDIFLADSGTQDWGDEMLGVQVLKPGGEGLIELNTDFVSWDLKAVTPNGHDLFFYDLHLDLRGNITLNANGTVSSK